MKYQAHLFPVLVGSPPIWYHMYASEQCLSKWDPPDHSISKAQELLDMHFQPKPTESGAWGMEPNHGYFLKPLPPFPPPCPCSALSSHKLPFENHCPRLESLISGSFSLSGLPSLLWLFVIIHSHCPEEEGSLLWGSAVKGCSPGIDLLIFTENWISKMEFSPLGWIHSHYHSRWWLVAEIEQKRGGASISWSGSWLWDYSVCENWLSFSFFLHVYFSSAEILLPVQKKKKKKVMDSFHGW